MLHPYYNYYFDHTDGIESQETTVSIVIDLKTALNHIHELKCLLTQLKYDLDSILTIEDFLINERFNHHLNKQVTILDYFKKKLQFRETCILFRIYILYANKNLIFIITFFTLTVLFYNIKTRFIS